MGEFTRITDPAEVVGKTVARLAVAEANDRVVAIVFEPGDAYFAVNLEGGYEPGDEYLSFAGDIGIGDKIDLGIASDQEIAMQEQSDAETKALRERSEREQYERLKARFEGVPDADLPRSPQARL